MTARFRAENRECTLEGDVPPVGFPGGDLRSLNMKFSGSRIWGEFDLGKLRAPHRAGSGWGIKSRFRPTSLISGKRERTSRLLPQLCCWRFCSRIQPRLDLVCPGERGKRQPREGGVAGAERQGRRGGGWRWGEAPSRSRAEGGTAGVRAAPHPPALAASRF